MLIRMLLYTGMSDDLTNYMVKRTRTEGGTPFVIKYVPYGALAEVRLAFFTLFFCFHSTFLFNKQVMPYLSRRAIENKSVLGGGIADKERRRAGSEIWKRVFRF
jgi:proline dehydrogenase